ncbi:amino acid adenylation domain-containing protein [Xenorhabdus sp. 18]|uniref:amino acid adenylation domain-containing protein n=1 Tax=Xenorhabdus doucetiae TaxID=351671 RepID=UPI0019ABB3E9|nr:amino acid adenylation domain-containing protein [Xenorhabdus sp. 18]MBD2798238.1 amino acid adenylation domain-containing protein [Xenorhabdus sp. 18]
MLLDRTCPLSISQQEVSLAIHKAGSNLNYHLCDVTDFKGKFDVEILKKTICNQFKQTEIFRTTLKKQKDTGQWVQNIHPFAVFSENGLEYLKVIDLSNTEDPEHEYTKIIDELLNKDADFEKLPLINFVIMRFSEEHYRMIEMISHIMIDGWGHSLTFRNISQTYNQIYRGEDVEPQEILSLNSIVKAEQEYRLSDTFEKDKAYWNKYCSQMPEPTQLVPGDAPLIKLNRIRKVFVGDTLTRLREVVSSHQLRLSSVLLAICATYIHRMTGQCELALGMPVGARQIKALREIPAMVANVLPLHLSFESESTVLSMASTIQRQLRRHLLHQTYRSEDMIRDLYSERGNKPLFNTLLNIVAYDQSVYFDGCETITQNVANGPASHLNIDIFDRNPDGRLEIGFNANAALYTPEALELHYQRLITLFEQFVETPSMLSSDYDLFLQGERTQYYPQLPSFSALPVFAEAFKTAATAYAERPALHKSVHGQEEIILSYATLNNYAERLAHHLQAQGVRPNDCVAVMFSRSIEWAVAAVALFKLGACYVPIDPDLPEARIEYILHDSTPSMIILAPGCNVKGNIASDNLLFLTINLLESLPDIQQALPTVEHSALAYLIYTSGSTGKPKGVEVTHRNLVSIARTAITSAELQPGHRVLQFIAAGFDMSVLEIMMTLLAGATLVITDKISSTPGKPLSNVVKREKINLLVITPSLLAYHNTEDFPQDMVLLLGGEPCTPALLARFSHCRLLNVYGPTETSFATSINSQYGPQDLSIGAPTANTRLYVVDRQQRLLPPGAWGELFIGGPGVARGYRNRQELTEKDFVPDLMDPNTLMYRVGDQVFFDHRGRIYYLGRRDNQIKLRGLRIELDEIKNALLSCAGITDAIAMLHDLPQGAAIISYVASKNPSIDVEELKRTLNRQLPYHMIPSIITVLPEFPLTPNGKLAIAELPAPVLPKNSKQVLPNTAEEKMLCHLFAEVLGCDQVYTNQSFFDLGGHSLLGLQLINRIKEECDIDLGIADFLASPTPHRLAQHLTKGNNYNNPFDTLLSLRTEGERPPLFCIHPGGGVAWPYAGLLPYLPEDQPVYAIQSPILLDAERIINSLDELAQEYMQLILSIQPHGPYQLAGWSVGGNLSLRIATMLQEQGHQVIFLCMFDSYPLKGGKDSLKLTDEIIISRMTRAIIGTPRAGIKGLKSAMEEVLGKKNIGEEFLIRLIEDSKLMLELLTTCEYDVYRGDLIFIHATEDILRMEDQQPTLWTPYISGSLVQYHVEAPHECLLQRQYLEQFGKHFAEELLKRQAVLIPTDFKLQGNYN